MSPGRGTSLRMSILAIARDSIGQISLVTIVVTIVVTIGIVYSSNNSLSVGVTRSTGLKVPISMITLPQTCHLNFSLKDG